MTALGRSVPPALGGASELVERAFLEPFFLLGRSISLFLSLPFSNLHRFSLKIRDRQYRAANDPLAQPRSRGPTARPRSTRNFLFFQTRSPFTMRELPPLQHRTVVLKSAGSPRGESR